MSDCAQSQSDRQAGSAVLLLYLGGLTGLTAMSVDISLPAIPGLAALLDAEISVTHAIVSLFLLGYAVMQPVYGPLSDAKGRKPVLLGGLLIFLVASMGCMAAQTMEQLFLARFIQGIGAGCGPVLARAILRDCYDGKAAERAMAMVMFMMALGPMIAPVIGSLVIAGWNVMAVFSVLALIALTFTLLTAVWFRETSAPNLQIAGFRGTLASYRAVWNNRAARYHMLAGSFVYASMLCYISASPAILIDGFGLPAEQYGYYFAISATALLIGALLNNQLLRAISIGKVTAFGAAIAVLGAVLMMAGSLTGMTHELAVVIPAGLSVFALAIVLPNTTVLAMQPFRKIAGTASAAIGSVQIIIGLALGFVVGAVYDKTAFPLAVGMCFASVLVVLFLLLAKHTQHRQSVMEGGQHDTGTGTL